MGGLPAANFGFRTTKVSCPRTLIVRAGSDEKFWAGPSECRGRDEVRLRRQLLSSFDSFEASDSLSWPSAVDSPLSLGSPSNSAELVCVLSSCDVDLSSLLRTVLET